MADHNGRTMGDSLDSLLGGSPSIRTIPTLGSATARIQSGNDSSHANNHGDCVSKICTSGRDNCQAQEKQVHHKSRYKLLEKV